MIELGANLFGINAAVYGFRGDKEREGSDPKIREMGIRLDHAYTFSRLSYEFGFGYLTSIAETDLMKEKVSGGLSGKFKSRIPGYDYFIKLSYFDFDLFFEYLSSTKAFQTYDLSFNGKGAFPEVYALHLSYAFTLLNRDFVTAIGLQKTEELLHAGLPESRTIMAINYKMDPNSGLILEYSTDEDYKKGTSSATELGTGSSSQSIRLNWHGYF